MTPEEELAAIKLIEQKLGELSAQLGKLNELGAEESAVCSFCGKSKAQVKAMIEGTSAKICDECVEAFKGMIAK